MAFIDELPAGLISVEELGIMAEEDDAGTSDRAELAELIIRCMSVLARFYAKQPDWTAETTPYEARITVLSACRRVFNNPQNQQRIQTGPLGESYHADDLTGLEFKDSEQALLATFEDGEDGDLGSLSIIAVKRSDDIARFSNADLVYTRGLSSGHKIWLSSLSKYLGLE